MGKYWDSNEIGVYQIKNLVNGKFYIGGTTEGFNKRFGRHVRGLRSGKHDNMRLQNDYNKYGIRVFEFSILEIVKNKEDCVSCEQKWMNALKPEYNMCPNAGISTGFKFSEESKLKLSEQRIGNKNALGNKNCLGRKLSEETKQKISNSNKGRKVTEEQRRKMSENNTAKRKIICITTGEIFSSIMEAAKFYNIQGTNISTCCSKRYKFSGKHPITKENLIWDYYNN
jgi:group I intron endonuclease